MNEMNAVRPAPTDASGQNEFTLINILIVFARNKKVLAGLPAIVAVVAAAISFALPDEYRAGTKLLPPQQAQSGAAALLSQIGGVAGVIGAGVKSPNELYIGMLKSRAIADRIIDKFELKKVYETDSPEKARNILEKNTVISAGKDGLISIEVDDKNRRLVAPMANAYVDELFRLTKILAVTESAQRRKFYEQQLESSKNDLAAAESALKGALESGGVINVDSDSRVIVEMVGRLRAQISANEVRLNAMRAFVTTDNPEFKRVQEEVDSSRVELSRLENGRPGAAAKKAPDAAGLESIRILREVKYHQMLYELLAKQYEIARLDEAKDPSIIQVLDVAIEPEHKYKPARTFIVVLSTLAALFAAIVWAFLVEIKTRATRSDAASAQWNQLRQLLTGKK